MNKQEFISDLLFYEKHLFGFALKLTRNYINAQDLIQDTFLKALEKRNLYKHSNLKAWLFRIMNNTFIDNCRKNKLEFIPTNKFYNSETENLNNYDLQFIENQIKGTEFEQYLQGWKYKEIAENNNLKIGTVKNRIHFLRKKLQAIFK